MQKFSLFIILSGIFMFSCSEEVHTPRPKGYNRFDLPEHQYKALDESHPFTFEYSAISEVKPHESRFSEPHWLDIKYPDLHATVELTYKDIDKVPLAELLADAHKLANKHNVKAYSIDQSVIRTKNGYTASLYKLEGEVPSQFQFFVTDSVKHFLRGALYFPIATKNDSLAPAIEYITTDMEHLLNSLEWTGSKQKSATVTKGDL